MTDAQIAYYPGSCDRLLQLVPPGARARPSLFDVVLGGFVRLLHAMAPAKTRHAAVTSTATAGAAVTREFMLHFQNTIVPHLDAAYNFARFLSRDPDAAQDIVQEAFLRAYRSFENYRGGDPRAWLFAIVRNCCHAWRQQNRRKTHFEQHLQDEGGTDDGVEHQIASEEDSPETALLRRSEQHRVRAVIDGLPEAMREILVLRELEDLSYRQIAEIIDAPIGTVMSRLARARQEFGEAWNAGRRNESGR